MTDAPPQVNAILLCDQAFQQMPTGKWCIIGTFNLILSPQFPFTYPPMTVFLCLSDFTGDAAIQVNIRDPEGTVTRAIRGQIPKIPMSILEFAFPIPATEFKVAGSYTLELLVGEQFLVARSFRVQQLAPGQLPPWFQQAQPGGMPPPADQPPPQEA